MFFSRKLSFIFILFRLSLVFASEKIQFKRPDNEGLSANLVGPDPAYVGSKQRVVLKQGSTKDDEQAHDDGDVTDVANEHTADAVTLQGGGILEKLTDGSAILDKFQRAVQRITGGWPMGIVPYYIDTNSYDKIVAYRIRKAMDMIERVSCVVFKNLPQVPSAFDEGNWLHITNSKQNRDCVHHVDVGSDGQTVMVLGFDCMLQRDILHALMHVLGFKDEVGHPQRDHFIRVMWGNIQPKYRSLFRINAEDTPYKKIVEYDTMSIMHFHDRAFSINGAATVAPLIPGLVINPSDNLSQLDVMKLRLAFGHECNKRKIGKLLDTCKMVMRAEDGPVDENVDENQAEGDVQETQKMNAADTENPDEAPTDNGSPEGGGDGKLTMNANEYSEEDY